MCRTLRQPVPARPLAAGAAGARDRRQAFKTEAESISLGARELGKHQQTPKRAERATLRGQANPHGHRIARPFVALHNPWTQTLTDRGTGNFRRKDGA